MSEEQQPWQLAMFDKSLKKKMKIKLLQKHLGELDGKRCFMVTCGDNNGAMNLQLREAGGEWTWAEFEESAAGQIEALLNEPVIKLEMQTGQLPFDDETFDRIVVIDCHEHLEDPVLFTREIGRTTKPGGRIVISVPNGDERMLAVRIKNLVGMTREKYGHIVTGYDVPELLKLLEQAKLKPVSSSYYSKFFTEMLELSINYAYVMVLSKKGKVEVAPGTIAPQSEQQLASVGKSYRLYSLVYPLFRLISRLDALPFFNRGYAVVVEAVKG